MTTVHTRARREKEAPWSNERLVRECLAGNEEAWSALIEKYKNLIFSIPIKYGFSRDAAADIFQAVCLELLAELPRLRAPEALSGWLFQITSHKCFHMKRQERRYATGEDDGADLDSFAGKLENAEETLHEVQQEQVLRQAVSELSPRCHELIHMLFFDQPARPYREIAATLGIASGSIGFIRGRCLERLRLQLNKMGFE